LPRHPDPFLEDQILNAAAGLWRKGGDKALTIRAVAQAAHTTTPTIYRRFKNREEILRVLRSRIQQDLLNVLQTCRSAQEATQRYVEFAWSHPHEYELFFADESKSSYAGGQRRSRAGRSKGTKVELMKAKLAEWLGGSAGDYEHLALALWALNHGTSMLLISKTVRDDLSSKLLRSCEAAVTVLVKNSSGFVAAKGTAARSAKSTFAHQLARSRKQLETAL
jgi:AcrR family transcriptional regulator